MLAEGIERVARISGKDSPVFAELEDQILTVYGVGDRQAASYRADVNRLQDTVVKGGNFSIAISPETAAHIRRYHKNSVFSAKDNTSLTATSPGGTTADFALLRDASPVGKLPTSDGGFSVDPEEFVRMFQEVKSASNNPLVGDIRFKGFHLNRDGKQITAMATDGNIIATSSTTVPSDGDDFGVLLGPEFFSAVESIRGATGLKVGINKSSISLSATLEEGSLVVHSPTVKAELLPYRGIVQNAYDDAKSTFRVDKKALVTKLAEISHFTQEDTHHKITLKIQTNKPLSLSASGNHGNAETTVELMDMGNTDKVDYTASLNLKYLAGIASSIRESHFFIKVGEGNKPMVFQSPGTYLSVLSVFTK